MLTPAEKDAFPRVTAILTNCGLREWPRNISQEDRQWYLERGTAIHAASVLFDNGTLDESSLDTRIAGFVAGYKKFRSEMPWKIVVSEHEVVSTRWGYRGTLDRVFHAPGYGKVLIDIKTNEADTVTRLQTAGYVIAYGRKINRRGAVGLKSDGTYRFVMYDDDASDIAAWLACVQLAAWKRRNGEGE
jgi:hypothetical protein